jgi:outer membrane receptor for ferrienterochelin and colicin
VNDAIFSFVGFNQNGVTTSSFKNIDLTRQFGFEGIAETHDWPIEGMNIDFNAAYIDSRTLRNAAAPAAEGVQFPRIPKWRINANMRYDLTDKLQGAIGMRYASRPNTDLFGLQRGDTFGFTSELFALDLRLNWQLTGMLRVSAGIDNLTNDRAWVFHPTRSAHSCSKLDGDCKHGPDASLSYDLALAFLCRAVRHADGAGAGNHRCGLPVQAASRCLGGARVARLARNHDGFR